MRHWIEAARIRTLPLSVSGIIVGSMYALANPTDNILTPTEVFNWRIFGFAILTTLGLQILSNFANDYGDGIKGTDNEDRVGPKRAIQSGVITPQAMKGAIIITSLLTLLSAILLIYFAFTDTNLYYSLFYLVLGILAILSAIRYTIGVKGLWISWTWRCICICVFWIGQYLGSEFFVFKTNRYRTLFAGNGNRLFECWCFEFE